MAALAERFVLAFLLTAAAVQAASTVDTKLTLHNLCSFPVYPLVTANGNFTSISNNSVPLDRNGFVSFPFPTTFWAGRVVARTGCASPTDCETGLESPVTVVQLVVHSTEAGPGADLATYSVSLAEGFNVGAVVSPQFNANAVIRCPALGCPANLNDGCPMDQRVVDDHGVVVACKGDYGYFKQRCPLTRVNGTDIEPVPQNCLAPRELKVIFCQTT